MQVDAVRHLTVRATGTTAARLQDLLTRRGAVVELLLSIDAVPQREGRRFVDRAELETALREWIDAHPEGAIVMSAAVNDYELAAVERIVDGHAEHIVAGAKIPSAADELVIRLRPAGKLIDRFGDWGHRGPLVGFKFEDADTVLDAAERLHQRCGAALVVANSLDGRIQALVDGAGTRRFPNREVLLETLADRLTALVLHLD